MFKIFKKIVSNKTYPEKNKKAALYKPAFPHYSATIIQLGWLGSPKYRRLLKKKLKRLRERHYRHHAAITIQLAWIRSRRYRKSFIEKVNRLLTQVERLDMKYVDEYINGIERIIR